MIVVAGMLLQCKTELPNEKVRCFDVDNEAPKKSSTNWKHRTWQNDIAT